ncbi:class I SAM-dependent methyltransferase [Amycolatopsis anabasis]|uniref:class I SAM-dependent methyltransferase n=1 Tax=Amycolatopsis anabasis TaxID=1840409 RepID=UPI00131BB6D2|nr:class I SAM-dependent methyltransferase [Amycolatopsis anabasis]
MRPVLEALDIEFIIELYRTYAEDLANVRAAQRKVLGTPEMEAKLDDVEAELTYLMIRRFRPELVTEVGTFRGWSTTWILHALRDNRTGRLASYDLIDNAVRAVPPELAEGRWDFHCGDVRKQCGDWAAKSDYLFIDAAHNASFARWYLAHLLPTVPAGTPVSVHDVFHHRRPLPFTEGAEVLRWLNRRDIPFFTAAPARAPDVHQRLTALRTRLGLGEPVHTGTDNPMLFFLLNN